MLSIYLFCLTFMFYCWLYTPQESQEGQSNSLGDAMGPSTNRSREVDSEALEENQGSVSISGWDVSEPFECYVDGWTIRNLKKAASLHHIKSYSTLTNSQLVEALQLQ